MLNEQLFVLRPEEKKRIKDLMPKGAVVKVLCGISWAGSDREPSVIRF